MVHRGAALVEDALRIATLPDGRRLLLIRSLNLGRIDPRRSSAAVALRIEAELAAHRPAYAAEDAAAHAHIVYFRDDSEPYTLLIQRVLRGQPADEWFWPRAVPLWKLLPRTTAAVAPLIQHVAQTQGPAAAVAVLDEIHSHGSLPALLDALPAAAAEPLLAYFGWRIEDVGEPVAAAVEPSWPVREWVFRWGIRHPLSSWLLAAALAAQSPARISYPVQLMRTVSSTLRGWDEMARDDTSPRGEAPASPVSSSKEAANREIPNVRPLDAVTRQQPSAEIASSAAERGPFPIWSGGAGILLLVNILSRLGMGELVEANPALQDFPLRLLSHFAARLELDADDPVQKFTTQKFTTQKFTTEHTEDTEGRKRAEGDFSSSSLLSSPSQLSDPRALRGESLHLWEDAVVTWLAHFAEMTLTELIARPGYLRVSKTHVDVFFAHEQADIRIRRAGIDFDPGWTPWLGRVISYFYTADPSAGEG
ncbi:MAG: hypothetical protein R2873_20905 [Caldilineaceae bacterium]